jgi:nucleoside-triphosphatase THEP1
MEKLKSYTSKDKVEACQIKGIVFDSVEAVKNNRKSNGSAVITTTEGEKFDVDANMLDRQFPKIGDYVIVVKDKDEVKAKAKTKIKPAIKAEGAIYSKHIVPKKKFEARYSEDAAPES